MIDIVYGMCVCRQAYGAGGAGMKVGIVAEIAVLSPQVLLFLFSFSLPLPSPHCMVCDDGCRDVLAVTELYALPPPPPQPVLSV